MTQTNKDLTYVNNMLKERLPWVLGILPVVVGVAHQLVMITTGFDYIPVLLDPPGYIGPLISLEFFWWFLLTVGSGTASFLIFAHRIKRTPTRVGVPFYLYLIFLLIFVKPV